MLSGFCSKFSRGSDLNSMSWRVFGTLIAWWWHGGLYSFEQHFAQSWDSFDTRAPQKPWLKGMDAIELPRSIESPWLDASWKQNRQMGVSKQAPKLSWNVVESSQRSRSMGKICSISLDKVAKWWWSMFILDSQEPNFGSWTCFTIQFSNMLNMGVS